MNALERAFITLILFSIPCTILSQTSFYRVISGQIALSSNAPLEVIKASTSSVRAIIDPSRGSFRFSTPINSFRGFNSALQKKHFNTNYMESDRYPDARFEGNIIEKIDFRQDGVYTIRAKGQFSVHGVSRERIIKGTLRVKNGKLYLESDFSVILEDHDITIPKIVNQKIAEEINIHVEAELAQI